MTRVLLAVGAVLVFGAVNWQIAAKETLRSTGQTVFLELAPVDPRSLMQGDFMALNFALARTISGRVPSDDLSVRTAVLRLNAQRVGGFERLDTGGPLNPGEMRFRFRFRRGSVWLGTNAFFFHEGDAERYQAARFGEFRVNENGDAMLVDLRDANVQKILPLVRPLATPVAR